MWPATCAATLQSGSGDTSQHSVPLTEDKPCSRSPHASSLNSYIGPKPRQQQMTYRAVDAYDPLSQTPQPHTAPHDVIVFVSFFQCQRVGGECNNSVSLAVECEPLTPLGGGVSGAICVLLSAVSTTTDNTNVPSVAAGGGTLHPRASCGREQRADRLEVVRVVRVVWLVPLPLYVQYR